MQPRSHARERDFINLTPAPRFVDMRAFVRGDDDERVADARKRPSEPRQTRRRDKMQGKAAKDDGVPAPGQRARGDVGETQRFGFSASPPEVRVTRVRI